MAGVRIALALVLAGCCAAGCQRDDKKKPPRRRAAEVAKPPPPVRLLGETVIRRGAEPHRLLRYRRTPAARHRHRRAVTAEVTEIENRERRPEMKLPEVTTDFSLSWRAAGSPLLEVAASAPEIASGKPPAVTRYTEVQTARFRSLLAGKTATVELSDRGLIGDVGGLASSEARRELAAALVDSIVVLPPVPVGVGGKWRVIRAVPRARTSVKHRATYTVESIAGDRAVIAVDLLVIGERQPIGLGAGPGAESELLALRISQTGELTVDLAVPTAVSGRLERADTVHLRTTRRQKTIRDYFARSRAEIELSTR